MAFSSPQSKPGVVWADHLSNQLDVSPAAARILGVGPGEIPASDFTLAMKRLVSRALNQEDLAATVDSLLKDVSEDGDFTLRFAEPPTHLRVSSHASRQVAFVGRVWTFDDVSAAHEAVASEKRYRLLAENAADVVFTFDPQGRIVWASPSVLQRLGGPPEYWIGRDMREAIAPQDRPVSRPRLARVMAGGVVRDRLRVVAADGVTRWVEVLAKPLRDTDGRINGGQASLRVIDGEVAARQELQAAHDLLQATADSMIDPQVLLEAVRDQTGAVVDFVYRSANNAARAVLGRAGRDLLGTSQLAVLPNLEKSGLVARYLQCLQDGQPVILDDHTSMLDQSHRYDIRVSKAGPNLLSFTWRDVTDRYEAAQRLAESERQYRLLAENSADIVCHVRDGRIAWVSPSVEGVTGHPAEALIGRSVLEFVPLQDVSAIRERLSKSWRGGADRVRVVSVDGVVHWLHLNAGPFYDEDGREDGVVASLRLADAEVAAEQALEAANELLRANADSMLEAQVLIEAVRDPAGRVVDFEYRSVNHAACSLMRTSESDLIGSRLLQTRGIDTAGLMPRWVRCLQDGRPVILDDFAFGGGASGSPRRFDIRTTRAGADRLSVTWSDVTDRYKATQRIADSERKYRLLAENSADVICHVRDGRIVWISPSVEAVSGAPPEYWEGREPVEAVFPDDVAAYLAAGAETRAGRGIKQRLRLVGADGVMHWHQIHAKPYYDEDGRPDGLIVILRLVDDDVAAERSANAIREQLEAGLESAAAYMASIMPSGLAGEVNVSSRYLPSQALGGDCFDYAWIDDDHLLVYLIDVSGHGVEPALLSVSVHNLLRSGSLPTETLLAPESALAELNRLFQMDDHGELYFTMWFGVYEASTRVLRYASAGAPPAFAFVTGAEGTVSHTELSTVGLPVGMFEDAVFTADDYAVPPGCRILIYSDGASQVRAPGGRRMLFEEFRSTFPGMVGSPEWSLDVWVDELMAPPPAGGFEDDCSLVQLTFE